MRQHISRWLGVSLWLVPVLALCGWVGVEALPALGARNISGALCSAGSSALGKAQPPPQLLTQSSRRSGGDRARHAAGAGSEQPLQRARFRPARPGSGGGAGAYLCAEPTVQQCFM